MYLLKRARDLQQVLQTLRQEGKSVGFIPTMGALHPGHLSLVDRAKQENQFTVCSIFVNPTQFNDPKDLDLYPRTPGKDIRMLASVGAHLVFMPPPGEIYPPGLDTQLDVSFGLLDNVMEGEFRPGHFQGVAQVVKRFLDLIRPDALYLGQKDFQQVAILRHLVHQLHLPVRIVMCPTLRETDGLAMSSRNVRLSPELRKKASILFETLTATKDMLEDFHPEEIEHFAMGRLSIPGFKPEYFEIVDGNTLQPVDDASQTNFIVACTAIWAGNVRLIDNMIWKSPE
ncbi:MAG: pantoate--beta-alanine ligase [Haliscomenobacter sp.]|nr:pantoate--beta-alanine ligase [Haliscomenobacter sp.]MBK7476824.1 pantoate--beta-alanine ligase [Haliscomenobacter sp.]MBK8878703.1 pantoate--beta-alanine ligase [Haliscomenobacter sp.]